MTRYLRFIAVPAVLMALVVCAPVQAQTPEIDALRARAEQGDADAQYTLGFRYREGWGVPEDDAEAMRWYRLAADQGHAAAQTNLGVMYGTGEGVPQDNAEAVRWYRLAAEQGFADAQFNLGVMYTDGNGVPQDYVLAHLWYNLSASRSTGEQREGAVQGRDIIEAVMTADQIADAQRLAREWDAAHPR